MEKSCSVCLSRYGQRATVIEATEYRNVFTVPGRPMSAFASNVNASVIGRSTSRGSATINSMVAKPRPILGVHSLLLKLTRGNFSQINVATYRNGRIKLP